MPNNLNGPLSISVLKQQYAADKFSPTAVVEAIIAELTSRGDDGIWIYQLPE